MHYGGSSIYSTTIKACCSVEMLPQFYHSYTSITCPCIQHFTPEILTIRSRGESVALARRKEMEREIEQHELERLLTSRDEPEVCGEDHTSKLRSPTDIAVRFQIKFIYFVYRGQINILTRSTVSLEWPLTVLLI